MPKILISSCLIGLNTRYNAKSTNDEFLLNLVKQGKAVFFCPEIAGGFSTPRDPAEIEPNKTANDVLNGNGRIFSNVGEDVTDKFINGAQMTLDLCKKLGVELAILKAASPSCGFGIVYDGTHTRNKIGGNGILAELLHQNGIKVYTDENYPKDLL